MIIVLIALATAVGVLALAVQVAEPILDGLPQSRSTMRRALSPAHRTPIRRSASPPQATDSDIVHIA
jgi:hypothetical protein